MVPYREPDDDFTKDFKRQIDDSLIPKYTRNMPRRLVDTYTGLILEQYKIVKLLKARKDYAVKLEAAVWEAKHSKVPIDPYFLPDESERPMFCELRAFISDFLAFAMFSHHWQGPEPTFEDVQAASRGIYSMGSRNLEEEDEDDVKELPLSQDELIKKLQEFCCVVAKCGFRWAWSDTCCINKTDYAELSLSINSMFLWYHSSHLTVVYLEDVEDVVEGRLPCAEEELKSWYKDAEIEAPHTLPDFSIPRAPSNIPPYLSLHDRILDPAFPRLRTMEPDTQIDAPYLDSLLEDQFPDTKECIEEGIYYELPIWVTRGWTLQEMLASKRLRFYSRKWTLLEEANDGITDSSEFISSFRYRARLVDHRQNIIWSNALSRATGVSIEDLQAFNPGAKEVRERLGWVARRTTTVMEDMAYCLLGIFDLSLPTIYGEGPRAFLRLQDELMKRTSDLSLFDWCGRGSSFNTFLAHHPGCFVEPALPKPIIYDSSDSIFRMIVNLFRVIFGPLWSGIKASFQKAMTWIRMIMESPPPGHGLINGELNVPLLEHRVRCCKPLERTEAHDRYFHYKLEVEGLEDTVVTFASEAHGLTRHPSRYYLCRPWNRHTQNIFQILWELIGYVLKDVGKGLQDFLGIDDSELEHYDPVASDEADTSSSKLREEVQAKRKAVMTFFKGPFPVYLLHVEDEKRVRVSTSNRTVSGYCGFDFTIPVVTRLIL